MRQAAGVAVSSARASSAIQGFTFGRSMGRLRYALPVFLCLRGVFKAFAIRERSMRLFAINRWLVAAV
jgi:hypothetical protein